uniref:Uncharacterized protein n=1 Tax=Cacopsylla melanoneura TaxID=428564 RepID=A0A8D8YMY2_9HEMI
MMKTMKRVVTGPTVTSVALVLPSSLHHVVNTIRWVKEEAEEEDSGHRHLIINRRRLDIHHDIPRSKDSMEEVLPAALLWEDQCTEDPNNRCMVRGLVAPPRHSMYTTMDHHHSNNNVSKNSTVLNSLSISQYFKQISNAIPFWMSSNN